MFIFVLDRGEEIRDGAFSQCMVRALCAVVDMAKATSDRPASLSTHGRRALRLPRLPGDDGARVLPAEIVRGRRARSGVENRARAAAEDYTLGNPSARTLGLR